jgi:hypothetical protein
MVLAKMGYILLADDFGSRRTLASPLAGRQLPVVSAYTRAKDSFTAVRCPTRSLSQNKAIQASRPGIAIEVGRSGVLGYYLAELSKLARKWPSGRRNLLNARKRTWTSEIGLVLWQCIGGDGWTEM